MQEQEPILLEEVREKERPVKLEINFLKNPFFVLSRKQLRELLKKTIEMKKSQVGYEDEHESWWVNPSAILGYAGPFDKKVFIMVQQLIIERGLPLEDPLIRLGSLRNICQYMKLADSGENKRLIKEALMRIAGAEIYTENTFYLRRDRRFWQASGSVGGYFHIWDVFWKGDRLPDGKRAECLYLYLNPPFILSLNAFYIKPIDFQYYEELESPLAQRLYEILGLRFYGLKDSPYVKYRYSKLCQYLPLTRQAYLSLAKQQLASAHAKLKKTGFLAKVEWQEIDERDWWILYHPGCRAQAEIAKAKEHIPIPEPEPIFEAKAQSGSEKEIFEVQALVQDILEIMGDEQSRPFYIKVAKIVPTDLIYRCLSEVKDEWHRGSIRTTKGAVFTDKIKRYCEERGIDLGLHAKNLNPAKRQSHQGIKQN